MYGFARNIMRYFHPNFGATQSTLTHDHPLGEGGNGVFPTTTYTTNAGVSALLMHKPEDNGSWVAEAHLHPADPGQANPLAFQILTQGYTVRVDALGITVLDAANTVMFQVP